VLPKSGRTNLDEAACGTEAQDTPGKREGRLCQPIVALRTSLSNCAALSGPTCSSLHSTDSIDGEHPHHSSSETDTK